MDRRSEGLSFVLLLFLTLDMQASPACRRLLIGGLTDSLKLDPSLSAAEKEPSPSVIFSNVELRSREANKWRSLRRIPSLISNGNRIQMWVKGAWGALGWQRQRTTHQTSLVESTTLEQTIHYISIN